MKAIVLSAGRGRRLLPFTAELPKCLLPVDANRPILELQLRALAGCGIQHVTVMVGFGAEKVERFLASSPVNGMTVCTRYNPFFEMTNTLVTCWLAIPEMTEDFVLLNGDTLFDVSVLRWMLAFHTAPVTMAVDQKAEYDEDDMKIVLRNGRRLAAVGKTLSGTKIDGESLGLIVFRDTGVEAFRTALNAAIRHPVALQQWYHDVIGTMARLLPVETLFVKGLWWTEIDTPQDLERARAHYTGQ
jgi:choline kinase